MTHLTDERLKSYLDTNQLHREQLALAALALDKRFTEVRPRHPRGGPDGGRDIEAIFRGEQRAFGAVGFVNQADDSEEKKKAIRNKFRDDLASALLVVPMPSVFIFLTNVNLTVGDKDALTAYARKKGLTHCEIFDREILRIALDSADGFAIRFQYLGITLSDAEQASFFAKWGDDINSVIATGFQKVQRTLDHLLFLQEATSPLGSLVVAFELDREYPSEEIGHFRAFCSVYLKEPKLNILSVLFGGTDKAQRFKNGKYEHAWTAEPGIKHGMGSAQWEQRIEHEELPDVPPKDTDDSDELPPEKYETVGVSSSIGVDTVKFVSIRYEKDSLIRFAPVLSLRDFDDSSLLPMLNRSLARRVKTIHILSNGYKLLEVSVEAFDIDETDFDPGIPSTFEPEELVDLWVRIRPKGYSSFRLSFSDEVPQRMFVSRQTKNSLPNRKAK
jgi:hypothetical protein